MILQGIQEKAEQGCSYWDSLIITIRKPDGDLKVCADYKIEDQSPNMLRQVSDA